MTPDINKSILVLVLMILAHFIADYTLQGWLAQAKQKKYWETYDKKYKYDYIAALICHSAYWAIIVFTPIMYFSYAELNWLWISLPANIVIHYFVDDLKANKLKINLIVDQLIHLAQIIITWLLWLLLINL